LDVRNTNDVSLDISSILKNVQNSLTQISSVNGLDNSQILQETVSTSSTTVFDSITSVLFDSYLSTLPVYSFIGYFSIIGMAYLSGNPIFQILSYRLLKCRLPYLLLGKSAANYIIIKRIICNILFK
jgi:hypothetical protein